MTRAVLIVTMLLCASPALAQDGGTSSVFVTGPLRWSPELVLRDFGWDSNVYGRTEAQDIVSDFTATLTSGLEGALDLTHLKVSAAGGADLIYYEKIVSDRAINKRLNGRVEVPLKRFVPSFSGAYQRSKDRSNLEVVHEATAHEEWDGAAGISFFFGTRAAIQGTYRRRSTTYDQGQIERGIDVAAALDSRSDGGTAGVRVNLTPLTQLAADVQLDTSFFPSDRSKDQRSRRLQLGFNFAPDAIISGRASAGWHRLDVTDPNSIPFQGFVWDVDLSYVLLGVTRFEGRYSKDTAVSIEAPYYVQTQRGLEITQDFLGPTDLVARVNHVAAAYSAIGDTPGRTDNSWTYSTGLAVQMSRVVRSTTTYEFTRRTSAVAADNFDRQRVLTSVSLGF